MKRTLSKLTALLLIAALLLPMAGVAESFAAGETPAELFEQPVAEAEYDLMAPELSEGEVSVEPEKAEKASEAKAAEPEAEAAPKSAVKKAAKKAKALTLGVKDTYALNTKKLGKNLSFKSTKPKIAAVDEKGVVTAKKKGKATVTALSGKKEVARWDVTVLAAPKKVSLGMKTLSMGAKETVQLEPKLAKNTAASFTWETSNKKIVTVTSTGKIKGRKAGKATVTATAHNGKKAKVTVTVQAAPKKVTLSAKSATLEVGKTLQLKATLPKKTASYKRTWKSSDASVATVNEKGVVTAVKAGTATITVTTFNKKKASCAVTVKPTADQQAAEAAIAKINGLPAAAGTADAAAVAEARAAYEALTAAQKALVSAEALSRLTGAEAQVTAAQKAAADQAAADAAIAKINALAASAGLGDKAAVQAARAAYDALTEDQKALVSAAVLNKLSTAEVQVKTAEEQAAAEQKAAEEKAAADQKAAEQAAADKTVADAAIAKINALPATAGVGDKAAVDAARAAYNALTDAQKKLVSAAVLKKLTDAEVQVKAAEEKAAADQAAAEKAAAEKAAADKSAADAAIAKINALPASAGADSAAAVAAARAAYDALTADQKALVSAAALKKLTDAEAQVAAAQAQAAADQQAANAVIALINALPASAGAADAAAVAAARAAYDALTDAQKALVSADVLNWLTAAEEQVQAEEERYHFAGTLAPDQAADAVIDREGRIVVYGFVPAENGMYEFFSTGDADTYGYLYDADMNEITHNDDYDEANFYIRHWLGAGTQYYFGVRYYDSDQTGTVRVTLTKREGFAAGPVGSSSIHVAEGGSATLQVAASGGGNLSYQWYRYDNSEDAYVEIEGATGASYSLSGITGMADYYCHVWDDLGNGAEVWFNVYADNDLRAQAKNGVTNIHVAPGGSKTLEVVASCAVGGLSYQWYQYEGGFKQIEGATGASYALSEITRYGEYICVVQDEFGHDSEIWFYVYADNNLQARPKNGSGDIYVVPGGSTTLEVAASCTVGGLSYQWYSRDVDDGESSVIEGATGASYAVTLGASESDYSCLVEDDYGNSRTVYFYVMQDNQFSVSRVGERDVYIEAGGSVTLEVTASCAVGGLTYQWYKNNAAIEGATGTVYTETGITRSASYECRVDDEYTGTRSIAFNVGVGRLEASIVGNSSIMLPAGEQATLRVTASSTVEGVVFQWYRYDSNEYEYIAIDGATGDSLAVSDAGSYGCEVSDSCGNESWLVFTVGIVAPISLNTPAQAVVPYDGVAYFSFIPSKTATYVFTSNSTSDTYGYLYDADMNEIAHDDDNDEEDLNFRLSHELTAGTQYYFGAGYYDDDVSGTYEVLLREYCNVVSAEPVGDEDVHAQPGDSVTLQVNVVSEGGAPSLQWYRVEVDDGESVAIPGATGATYTTEAFTAGNVPYAIGCYVRGDRGVQKNIWFYIHIDNQLVAQAKDGNENLQAALGEKLTLEVEADCAQGNLQYVWWKVEDADYVRLEDETGPSIVTDEMTDYIEYLCAVLDEYGNDVRVRFYIDVLPGE